MRPGPVVSTTWLAEHLDDPGVAVVEVSFYTPDKAAYFRGHIPGAHYTYWKDFCWDETDREFPAPATMARRLGAFGVGDDALAVLVGDTIQFATYAYWALTLTGLEERVTVLDGGHRTWEVEGRPMTTAEPPAPPPALPTPGEPDTSSRMGRDEVLAGLQLPERRLIDMRSDEEFRGERVAPLTAPFDHGAERGGHIPGARQLYYERLLDPDGTFKSPDRIAQEFASEGAGPDTDVVTYCRLSHRASLGWFVLTRLDSRRDVRVYDGSWTEWGSMVGMPVER